MKDDIVAILEKLDELSTSYPKIYRAYIETGREYNKVSADKMLEIFSQYASQPLRDHALVKAMELEDISDKWQLAKYEYSCWRTDREILDLKSKLLQSLSYMEKNNES